MNALTKKLAAGVIAAATLLGLAGLGATTANAANPTDGVIKVNSTNPEFEGKTATAYLMFSYDKDAVDAGTATNGGYTLVDTWDEFFKTATLTGLTGVDNDNVGQKAYDYVISLSAADKADDLLDFASKASAWAKDTTHSITGKTSEKATKIGTGKDAKYTATISGLSYGYYVVSPEGGSTSTDRHTDAILKVVTSSPVEQDLKSTYPTVEKTITGSNGNDKGNSAEIGESVNFKLSSTIPDMTEYTKGYTFNFLDTLSEGLTLNNTTESTAGKGTFTATVKVNGTPVETDKYKAEYVENGDGTTSVTITMLNFRDNYKDNAGETITVEYSATLNENATVAGSTNSAKVEYSNDPSTNGTGTSKEDKTHTYDFNFDVNKVDGTDNTIKLSGAQFALYRGTKDDANKIKLVKVSDNTFRPAKENEQVADDADVKTNDGVLKFVGLAEGTYKLVETKAPTGANGEQYNILTEPIDVIISAEYNDDGTLKSWSVNNTTSENNTGTPVITVENNKGGLLPGTGGMGTMLFTVFGVAIVALGAVWYVRSNRKDARRA
ncbi:cell surface protein [Bifidobacterium sp. DSM 109958]|uniref:Cell surface protein n=1 Tax=Bifidobacterium moraviense TaxID=2675323 RepID=A0A7Y0F341_9BIFI|nr:SpaH/EbpB family LPXTG-anchored major pilin [Bifidobacterium sp. DSM 109958]NMN01160.1 cell surface protein [Bifidobacterium sp. DSM 109958]